MTKILKSCFIKPFENTHPPIQIAAEKVFMGRSPETEIQDLNVSRQQICLKANFKEGYVLVKRLGSNPSMLNGKSLDSGIGYEAHDGDILELLPDKYQYTFELKYEESKKRSASPEKDKKNTSVNKAKVFKGFPDPKDKSSWEDFDSKSLYIFTAKNVVASEKIASYDMDGTLIKTKSGNVFPKSMDDWQIAFPEVPGKLKSLVSKGFKIVIFTNQAGISKGKVKIEELKLKIEALVAKLNVPIQVFISTGKGKYRKPMTGMWKTLAELKNDEVKVDKARSFYVGDAAGRPEIKKPIKRKKDHSSADRLMALNIGIEFFTPEQHFQNSKERSEWQKPEFDPKSVFKTKNEIISPEYSKLTSDSLEVILMVGFPGSGKSHFTKTFLESNGYVLINRDTMGSWQKCVSSLESALRSKKKAVIDNTNPDAESRKRFVSVAKKMNVPCRCFIMDVSYKQSKHNNVFRELTDKSHSSISDMIFNMYKSKYQEPTTGEGFSEIVKVNFIPKFNNSAEENLYKLYLLES